jgi:hypothetical protein
MSNCVDIFFPPTTRLDSVAIALAALDGAKVKKAIHDHHSVGEFHAECDAVSVRNAMTDTPEMAKIIWTTGHGEKRQAYYHFENDTQHASGGRAAGWRLMSMNSVPRNIALAKRLVQLFGGRVVYQDVSNRTWGRPDYKRPEYMYNAANDGAPYFTLQRRLASIKPITTKEIEACDGLAGYTVAECDPEQRRGYEGVA